MIGMRRAIDSIWSRLDQSFERKNMGRKCKYSHRIIQYSIEIVLIIASVGWVSVEDFSDGVHTSGVIVAGPEGLLNVFNCIDA